MVCLKQAVSAHCMDFSVWTFYKASACSVSITFSRATSEGGELCVAKVLTGKRALQQNSFPEQLPSLRALEQNCTQGSCYNLLLLVWED